MTEGRLVDDSIRGHLSIGLTDRRVVCLSSAGDLVDVEYATISTIRSFTRSRLTVEGIDRRLLTVVFGGLSATFVAVALSLTGGSWTDGESIVRPALVSLAALAALVAIFGGRLFPTRAASSANRWLGNRWATLATVGRRIGGLWDGLSVTVVEQSSRTYWWLRRHGAGVARWFGDRTQALSRHGHSLRSTTAWWISVQVRSLLNRIETAVDAAYRQYAVRTDQPLAPLVRSVLTAWRSAPVRLARRFALTAWRALGVASTWAIRRGRVTLIAIARRRPVGRLRSTVRTSRSTVTHAVRSRVPAVERPRRPRRPSFSLSSPAPSARGRRVARVFAGLLAIVSVGSLVVIGTAPLVFLALAAAGCSLCLVAVARRYGTECTGVQLSRRRETEVSIHTVDGDVVRLLLDPETDLDVELSRSAASVSRTAFDGQRTGSVAE